MGFGRVFDSHLGIFVVGHAASASVPVINAELQILLGSRLIFVIVNRKRNLGAVVCILESHSRYGKILLVRSYDDGKLRLVVFVFILSKLGNVLGECDLRYIEQDSLRPIGPLNRNRRLSVHIAPVSVHVEERIYVIVISRKCNVDHIVKNIICTYNTIFLVVQVSLTVFASHISYGNVIRKIVLVSETVILEILSREGELQVEFK